MSAIQNYLRILNKCVFVLFSALCLFTGSVYADGGDKRELGTLYLQFENNLFSGAGQHYTNGIRVSWLSPEGDTIKLLQVVRKFLEQIAQDENKSTLFSLSMGQEIYTPEDRYITTLIFDDRPYAGWLYGSI